MAENISILLVNIFLPGFDYISIFLGTKASAVTYQHIAFRSARIPPAPILVDVPFFFGIYNAKINAFLFTGVVNNPTSN